MRDGIEPRLLLGLCVAVALAFACGDDDESSQDAGPDGGGAGSPSVMDSGPSALPNGTAGKACTSHRECGGGTCAAQIAGVGLAATQVPAPGGYCTLSCMTDAECGGGGACVFTLGATIAGQCLATCTSTDDCREGYVCGGGLMFAGAVVPDTCRPAPETDQLEDGVAGAMCASAEDCPGGMCLTSRTGLAGSTQLPGGYCSGRCVEDANCGEGGVCMPALLGGAGSCYQACDEDGDCTRDGYRCRSLGGQLRGCNPAADPLPDDTAGDACTSDADCGGATGTCLSELPASGINGALGETVSAPGGYCSQACAETSDCGAGGVCTGGLLGGGYCYKPCTSAADCRDGYVCEDRGGAGFPGAGGAPADGGTATPDTVCVPEPSADEQDAGTG